ncbi:chromosomal replication initiator protein DnaA [Celeribacter indicus]|uniref:Chromosomal replication initiator protein DnaA n=1 Tax=Celeribacter indicus TaxID=1208324 RepID=A0A0B5DVE7_9RHOB|nr:chromosomal replication initiator protein DnaA [Celeribacter indicus]AJE44716.1 chromosomal replication initiation protein [Celeribacter indicus]SDX55257.1 chromosomal replication initiator protein DnaA [Celeribacter indicus]
MNNDTWGRVKDRLLESVGPNNFANWIEPLELKRVDNGVAEFSVRTNFMANWVARNFSDTILTHLKGADVPASRVEFRVEPHSGSSAPVATAPKSAQPVDATPEVPGAAPAGEDLPGAPLDPRFTFDNFVVGKPNELAHAAARRVAEGGPVTFNPLFLYGGVGLGKTHLMHAIAHEIRQRRPELRVLYLSAEQFMYRFVQALRDRQMIDFKQIFRSVDVLMVDDVQFIAGKDSTQEEFFHTFNALVDQGKQIIISADRAPGEIKDMEDRIRSRLQCGLVVDLHPTDYELRLGVLQTKAETYRAQYPDLRFAEGVLEFLAHRISTNVRVLEGALMRLFAFASLVGREITLDLTQECLSDILKQSDRKVTVEEIQRKVAEHYAIRLSDMIGPKRVRSIARPRQVAMYLAKQLTSRSLPEIGRRFGGRDHTTVMHGVRRIEELKGTDSQIADDIELLRRALEA